MDEPLVTVVCKTYNHGDYIRDALEGFLMQRANFPIEVIVHDDASTDATPKIISEYASRHPDIIKPIYQTENQYSQGKRTSPMIYEMARGKYIAFCEGDDYWINPLKLQRQVEAMEKHPDCNICFHPAIKKTMNASRRDEIMCQHSKVSMLFSTEDVITGGGEFMPTASLLLRKRIINRIEAFFEIAPESPVGDYYVQVLGAEDGNALYLTNVDCVYRSGCPGSWSSRNRADEGMRASYYRSKISSYEKLDIFTKYKYTKFLNKCMQDTFSGMMLTRYLSHNRKQQLIQQYYGMLNIRNQLMWKGLFRYQTPANIFQSVISSTTIINYRA